MPTTTSATERILRDGDGPGQARRIAWRPADLVSHWRRWQAGCDAEWQAALAGSRGLRAAAERDPALCSRVRAPYLARTFDRRTRYEVLASHYRLLDERFPPRIRASLLERRDVRVASLALERSPPVALHLRPPALPSAGELGLYLLTCDRRVLASCTLTFGGVHGVLIGAMHGSWAFMGRQPICAFTRAAHGLRPKNLLLSLAYALRDFSGMERLRAVADVARPVGTPRRAWRGAPQDGFWLENGGTPDGCGCFELPTVEFHCLPDRVPSKRRAARRRREALREYAREQLLFALRYASPPAPATTREPVDGGRWPHVPAAPEQEPRLAARRDAVPALPGALSTPRSSSPSAHVASPENA